MFEAAELGHKISKSEFERREPQLHQALLALQARVRAADFPVIVIVSGVEGAGKGDVVSLLHRWMDVRGLETHAFWDETDEERQRPRYWRYCPRGTSNTRLSGKSTKTRSLPARSIAQAPPRKYCSVP